MLGYIIGALLIFIALYMMAICSGWGLPYFLLLDGLQWMRNNPWESLLIAILVLLIGLIPFLKPRQRIEESFLMSTQQGEVRLTAQALADIIVRSGQNLDGVKLVRPRLKSREDGLEVMLDCQLLPEVVIPNVTTQLQSKVKEDVERLAGIKVAEVKVLVRRTEQPNPQRLPRVR
ncbi:MAG: alkaline shock response membrane anchor protein AmaP [Desulfitobacterium sp.]|nr:alkaline shock response membrane anchor protein AmaP [Desulfitobacterium sp.]